MYKNGLRTRSKGHEGSLTHTNLKPLCNISFKMYILLFLLWYKLLENTSFESIQSVLYS